MKDSLSKDLLKMLSVLLVMVFGFVGVIMLYPRDANSAIPTSSFDIKKLSNGYSTFKINFGNHIDTFMIRYDDSKTIIKIYEENVIGGTFAK